MKSIITENPQKCYLCGSFNWIEIHHVFGASSRKKAEKYGLVVPLCHYCHNEPPNGVHHNRIISDSLKEEAQIIAMRTYGWSKDDFIREFGKNYVTEEID